MADDKLYLIGGDMLAKLVQLLRWRANFKVVGARQFTNTPDAATLVIGPPPPPSPASPKAKGLHLIRVRCTDDRGHAEDYVTARELDDDGEPTGPDLTVLINFHTSTDDVFDCETDDVLYTQLGFPHARTQFTILQCMDGSGRQQSIDFDGIKGLP